MSDLNELERNIMIYATEHAAAAVAKQMNSNLSANASGSYIVRIQTSGKGWRIRWLAYGRTFIS
jgi:hypothetical protein